MATNKKLLFISHSSADKKNVDEIYNYLKDVVKIKDIHNYKIVYSSADDPNDALQRQKLIETIGQAAASTVFIAYITRDYIESKDCLLELGAAVGSDFIKELNKKLVPKYLCIKDGTIRSQDLGTLSDLINKKISDILVNDIGIRLNIQIEDAHKEQFQDVVKRIDSNRPNNTELDTQKAVSDIKRFITGTFNNHSRLHDKPVIIYTDRPIYESLSIELAKLGERQILWTLYRSPLKNNVALKKKNKLTDYDVFFNTLKSDNKKRLIIFETNNEANEYLNKKNILDSTLQQRKEAFEEMNKGNLYYTTVRKIKNAYHTYEITKIKGKDLFYEFAYLKNDEFNFIVFSEFSSEISTKDTDVHPLIFIKAGDHEIPKFGISKYTDSSLLSRFISLNFRTLLREETIKQIC